MNRRSFLKSLLFLFASLSLKIFPTEKTKTLAFNYGVASGDPTNTNVILWTKISGGDLKDKKIKWEVSNQKSFQKILVSGNAKAKFDDNFTVKVDAQIPPYFNGKTIYYRFSFQGIVSDIGTTKTLPVNNPNKFNIAFCSCSNYPAGYFNAYKEMANDEEVDLVEPLVRLLAAGAHAIERAEIADDRVEIGVGHVFPDCGNRRVELGLIASGEHHMRAFRRHCTAGFLPQSRIAAGDEHRLARQVLACEHIVGGAVLVELAHVSLSSASLWLA